MLLVQKILRLILMVRVKNAKDWELLKKLMIAKSLQMRIYLLKREQWQLGKFPDEIGCGVLPANWGYGPIFHIKS